MKRNKPAENTCVHTVHNQLHLSMQNGLFWWEREQGFIFGIEWSRNEPDWQGLCDDCIDWAAQLINVYLLCPMGFWAISIASHFESGSCHNLTAGAPRWHQLWISMSLEDPPSLTMLAEDIELHRTTHAHYSDITNILVVNTSKAQLKAIQKYFKS